jgi:hypothetical protein
VEAVMQGGPATLSTTTITGPFTFSGLLAPSNAGTGGYFLQTNGSNALSWQPNVNSGAGAGASFLQVTVNGVQISSPTSTLTLSNNFTGVFVAGATSQIDINSKNILLSSSSLQSGTTFYVSSGTVNGPLTVDQANETWSFIPGTSAGSTGQLLIAGNSSASPSKFEITYDSLNGGLKNSNLLFSQTNLGTQVSGWNFQDGNGNNNATISVAGTGVFTSLVDGGTSPLLSTSTLQSGATFYVSSGSVNGPFYANSINTPQINSPFFANAAGQSIYGNLIATTSVTTQSSMTVTIPATPVFSHYVVRLNVFNATVAAGTVFMRINNDASNHYASENSGFSAGVSSGSYCGTAPFIPISNIGGAGVLNEVGSAANEYLSGTFNIDSNANYEYINGTLVYFNVAGPTPVQYSLGGYANTTPLQSIEVWVGTVASCTSMTDPLNGTTGTMEVWGVF